MELQARKCLPCEGEVPPLTPDQVMELLEQVTGWVLRNGKLHKTFKFKDFVRAMRFVSQMAEVAEAEGHHPDFFVHYNRVDVTIWTHAIGGLTENDFILAAKLDSLLV